MEHVITQHAWLEIGSFSTINIIYFVQWPQNPWTELYFSIMVIAIDSPDVTLKVLPVTIINSIITGLEHLQKVQNQ